jgi:hypothetical protein
LNEELSINTQQPDLSLLRLSSRARPTAHACSGSQAITSSVALANSSIDHCLVTTRR